MAHAEFVKLVHAMREAQTKYFRRRDNLAECKRLEKLVDRAIANFGPTQAGADVEGQQPLFGDAPQRSAMLGGR
jgi:hypothetical protein